VVIAKTFLINKSPLVHICYLEGAPLKTLLIIVSKSFLHYGKNYFKFTFITLFQSSPVISMKGLREYSSIVYENTDSTKFLISFLCRSLCIFKHGYTKFKANPSPPKDNIFFNVSTSLPVISVTTTLALSLANAIATAMPIPDLH